MSSLKNTFLILCILLCKVKASAQLSNGSIAPDFTFTDILGATHNLYSYLNQGKYVTIDASATWCQPCWNYHNTHVLDSLYQSFDMPGSQSWKVLFVEIDGNTGMDDLQGLTSASQGNWLGGTNYTVINPPAGTELSDFRNGFNIGFYPTFYLICPDKRVYHLPGGPLVNTWVGATDSCATTDVERLQLLPTVSISPVPAHGEVKISVTLPAHADIRLTTRTADGRILQRASIRGTMGQNVITHDVSSLPTGLYFFTFLVNGYEACTKKVIIH